MLYRLFDLQFFKSDEVEGRLDIDKLLMLGILLCNGTTELKCRVFYDILQDDF